MNIERAKSILISEILDKMNSRLSRQTNTEAWYYSPFRNEKTPSFHVNKVNNVWYDFGEAKGGDTIQLVRHYLASENENSSVSDALRWIGNMTGHTPVIANVIKVDFKATDPKLTLKTVNRIAHPALIQYLEKRGIPISLGRDYLREIKVLNTETQKTFFALGIRNEDAGYELRNLFFKGSVGKKNITFIRGTKPKPDGIHFFEGFMDFLSVIAGNGNTKFEDDTIILNSVANLKKASPYLYKYGYKVGYTWMDNDESGKKATKALNEYFKTQSIRHKPMNESYEPHKDVNAWHMDLLGLPALG
jgi:hypothetical protein